jgi:two-component system NtrC family sensor kinase
MKNRFKRLSRLIDTIFHFRYIVPASMVLFLVIVGVGFLFVYQDARVVRDRISDDFNQQQLILARQAASQIDAILRDVITEVQSIASYCPALGGEARSRVLEAAYTYLHLKGVTTLGLMDKHRNLLEFYGDQRDEKLFRFASETPQHFRRFGPLRLERLSVDTTDPDNRVISSAIYTIIPNSNDDVVFTLLDVSRLVASVTGNIRSGKTGYAWVIDESGTFLYHPEREFIGKNAFLARRERKPYVSFSKINEIMKDRMLEGEEGTGTYISGWHRGLSGEINKLIAYTPVRSASLPEGSTWSVAVVAPVSEVAEAVHHVYTRHFGAAAALIAVLFIFGLTALMYQRRLSQALEARVSRQEEYMNSLLESSGDAIILIDNENRVQVWNRGAEMIFGYTAKEMIGQTFHCLIPPELNAEEELNRIRQEVEEKGHVRHTLAKRITKDGRRITIDLSRTLVREKNGDIAGSIAIITDITEKMEVDQRIYNTEKLASIGILAAGVAHEINNPLAIILGFTDLLLEKTDKNSPAYEDLKMIEFNANHAKKVVDDMLGFARVSEGREDNVDVPSSIETVVGICKNTLMTQKIDLSLHIADHLPRIRGDTREFQQVIFNLINNAVAAMMPEGGSLTLSAREEDGWVHVSVTDTGVGIPDKIKRQIFDPFFTTKKAGEGTGLGLSLCYGIVKKYGGKITFTSVSAEDHPDHPSGTTFTVTMPVYDAEVSDQGGNV